MILYVNGDSHSAGAETAGPWCFAEDDSRYGPLGRQPHPENLKLSYGQLLADKMSCEFRCEAESASSNHRIIRTTWQTLLKDYVPDFVVIGWSTWERKEFHDRDTGRVWQVNAGGIGDDWPEWLKTEYPQFIEELDWRNEMYQAHSKIHQFHVHLQKSDIRHLFFNTYSFFDTNEVETRNWNNCYLDPYSESGTYYSWCLSQGFEPVSKNSYHFGADAHAAWAEYLYTKIIELCLTQKS